MTEEEHITSRRDSKTSWSNLFKMIIARTGKNVSGTKEILTVEDLITKFDN